MFSDDANSVPNNYRYVRLMFVRYESSEGSLHTCTCIFCYSVPSICQWTAEQQLLHITGFLDVIYAILNASVILQRNEKCLQRNEKRLERNETCLARNEMRGGNLLLGWYCSVGTWVLPITHGTWWSGLNGKKQWTFWKSEWREFVVKRSSREAE